jgi:CCR4-NOT transcription complex subunit 6
MFGQNGYQNQHGMMNGHQNQRYGGMHLAKHQQGPYGHHNQMGQHPGQHHHSGHIGHQQTLSGGFPNPTSHLTGYTQDHMHNGHDNGLVPDDAEDYENNTHWKDQRQHYEESRELSGPNQRAKVVAHQAKGVSYVPMGAAAEEMLSDGRGRLQGSSSSTSRQTWDELDLGGQGLHAVSPILFDAYRFIKRLDLNFNNLTYLPAAIGDLKCLEHLDISNNSLTDLPPEIGMLTNLTHLFLFDNRIQTLCYELGFLFKLEALGVLGNPLEDGQKDKITEGGTKALISHLRESMPGKYCTRFITTVLTSHQNLHHPTIASGTNWTNQ